MATCEMATHTLRSTSTYTAAREQAVKVITKAEEVAGKRYMGNGEVLVNGRVEKQTPRVGRLLFGVEDQPYWTCAWGDAPGAAKRIMRQVAVIAQRKAHKAKSSLPFGNAFTVKALHDTYDAASNRHGPEKIILVRLGCVR